VANTLPIEVQQFILNHIDSVEQLEVLLLLSSSPARAWSVDEVNAQIKSSHDSVSERLQLLASRGLVTVQSQPKPLYQFQSIDPQLTAAVTALAANYKEKRLKVLECLFSKPNATLRIFADSFKIRKDDKNA
jgi:hypothetical protein